MKGLIAFLLMALATVATAQNTQQPRIYVLELDDTLIAELDRRNGLKSRLPGVDQFDEIVIKYVKAGQRQTQMPKIFNPLSDDDSDADGLNPLSFKITEDQIRQLIAGNYLRSGIKQGANIGLIKVVKEKPTNNSTQFGGQSPQPSSVVPSINNSPSNTNNNLLSDPNKKNDPFGTLPTNPDWNRQSTSQPRNNSDDSVPPFKMPALNNNVPVISPNNGGSQNQFNSSSNMVDVPNSGQRNPLNPRNGNQTNQPNTSTPNNSVMDNSFNNRPFAGGNNQPQNNPNNRPVNRYQNEYEYPRTQQQYPLANKTYPDNRMAYNPNVNTAPPIQYQPVVNNSTPAQPTISPTEAKMDQILNMMADNAKKSNVTPVANTNNKSATAPAPTLTTADTRIYWFIWFLFFFSVGVNIFLYSIWRSSHVRYQELADDLRQTFSQSA
jgi:hypothetical protein